MIRKSLAAATAAAAMALHVGSASTAELAEGIYDCTTGSYYLGEISIEGGKFAGLAFDLKFGESHPFDVAEDGAINWGGPGPNIGSAKVVSTVLKEHEDGRIGFDITIRTKGGNTQTIICTPR